jgi:hypothetical protein
MVGLPQMWKKRKRRKNDEGDYENDDEEEMEEKNGIVWKHWKISNTSAKDAVLLTRLIGAVILLSSLLCDFFNSFPRSSLGYILCFSSLRQSRFYSPSGAPSQAVVEA